MESQLFWSLLTFLLGLLVGHRLSLGRDRRKEFNELSRETYRTLIHYINTRRIDKVSVDAAILAPYFSFLARSRFICAVEKYNSAEDGSEYDTNTGAVTSNEECTDNIVKQARNVAKFLSPR